MFLSGILSQSWKCNEFRGHPRRKPESRGRETEKPVVWLVCAEESPLTFWALESYHDLNVE